VNRRTVWAGVTAAVLAGSTIGGAGAASAADAQTDGPEDTYQVESISAQMKIDPLSNVASLVDVKALTGLVDTSGNLIGSLTTRPLAMPAAFHTGISQFSCVQNGTSKSFVAYTPTEIFLNDGKSVQQDQFFLYRKDGARTVGPLNTLATQYEMCATGGAQPTGHRATQIGLGVAFPDANQNFKIGQDWRTGNTPANYTSTLGFQLGPLPKVPLSISGSISQTPSDKLMGSLTGPFHTPGDAFARNAVNAWWQDSCMGSWHRCYTHWDGTKDFHGTVAQGLWEFTPDQVRSVDHFEVRSYVKY